MDKLGRNYSLIIENTQTFLPLPPITLPLTIEFEVHRFNLGSSNTASIRLYNLSENTRNYIKHNAFDTDVIKRIKLRAGYGGNLPLVFDGQIYEAWSVREGNTFVTQIECFDVGNVYANATVNIVSPKGSSKKDQIEQVVQTMAPLGITLGRVGNSFDGDRSTRQNSLNGSAAEVLKDLSGDGFYVDNGKAYCLGTNECIRGDLQVIDSTSGLLGSPIARRTSITFDMLFEPRLLPGQYINLSSTTNREFNGPNKVVSIGHRATISDAVCGDAITSVTLFSGNKDLEVLL